MGQDCQGGAAQEEAEAAGGSAAVPLNSQVQLLQRLCFGQHTELRGLRLALVVAHPDDECIGAGARLVHWKNAQVIYVTDGAPRNPRAAHEAGFPTREDYARARRTEAGAALALAGIPRERTEWLGFVDQEASLELVRLSRVLATRLAQLRPHAVMTQPYEGGHPDHDATAFAVHSACRLLREQTGGAPVILEMTAYHNCAGAMATSAFLPSAAGEGVLLELSPGERVFKQHLFDCFKTQQQVLQYFPVGIERFRGAPHYDFSRPPHSGTLYYELFDWGMNGARWRQLARQAMQMLGAEKVSLASSKAAVA